jgi:hypothetical protein
MSENWDLRILQLSDREAVMDFAKHQLAFRISDPMEREMQSWSARWRGEALDHYLPQGWSFGAFKDGKLQGFILAQPVLFYRGLTQTLWVEHVESELPEVAAQLLDCAQRWARDKHFQCVVHQGPDGQLIETKTARFR